MRTLFATCIAALGLAGCAPMITQSPGEGLSPVNAVSEGEDKHLMLFGYDVVNYSPTTRTARAIRPSSRSTRT